MISSHSTTIPMPRLVSISHTSRRSTSSVEVTVPRSNNVKRYFKNVTIFPVGSNSLFGHPRVNIDHKHDSDIGNGYKEDGGTRSR